MARLPILLIGMLNSEPKDSVNYTIAYHIVERIDQMESMNISDLAKQCNVSKATVSRFCRDLGFENFYEMRADFAEVKDVEGMISTVRKRTDAEFLTDVKNSADLMLKNVSEKKLDRLADMINQYENIAIMGHIQSGNAALMLQHDLMNVVNHLTQVLNRPSEQISFFEEIKKPCLVIVFSIRGRFFHDLYNINQVPRLPEGSAICMITTACPKLSYSGVDLHLDTGTGNDFASGNLSMILLERIIALHCGRRQSLENGYPVGDQAE